ncbi:MAG: hypothetical protein Q7W13_09605 [Bacteroidia bacterium]|nr:hypothetical protein [Bacteroidia bacterium]
MNNIKLYGLTAICLLLAFLLMAKSCELEHAKNSVEKNRVPDTVFVPKPYKVVEIKKEYIEKPVRVLVYLKDTTLRKQAEQSDIITGINFKRHNLFQKMDFIKIDKINPQGVIFSNEYHVPPVREIKIDLNGNLQTKKKRYIGLKIIASAVIVGTTSYFIHREIHK